MTFTDPQQLCDALGIPFSDQQLRAATAPLEPGVIMAGAGTGKTTVMAARVVWLVGTQQVQPEEVLGLTFTRKAAGELATRVRSALQRAGLVDDARLEAAGEELIMTYDAFAGRLVGEFGALIGRDVTPTMITGAARHRLVEEVVTRTTADIPNLSGYQIPSLMQRVLDLDAAIQANLVTADDLVEFCITASEGFGDAPLFRGNPYADVQEARRRLAERVELIHLVREYQAMKSARGLMEFSDQLRMSVELVRAVPSVVQQVRASWRVVLLDEYQDTSAAQAELLYRLFGEGHPVTAVGDPCQAIYGWRGAAANNITGFADRFRSADDSPAALFDLTVNRRSQCAILDLANDLAEPLAADPFVADSVNTLVAPPGTGPGRVETAALTTWHDEMSWVADRILAAHPHHGGSEVEQWSDVAVLCRRNGEIGPLFAHLRDRQIPVEIVGLSGLLSVPEVSEVVAVLRIVADDLANPETLQALSGRWAIGPRDLHLLARRAAHLAGEGDDLPDPVGLEEELLAVLHQHRLQGSLFEATLDPGPLPYSTTARERFAEFAAEIQYLRARAQRPVAEVVRDVIDTIGIEVEVRTRGYRGDASGDEQLAAFVDAVGEYADVDPQADLAGLLSYLRAEQEFGVGLDRAVPSEADSVKLMTIHRAKGLEWDLVILPALNERTFPSDRVTDNWTRRAEVLPADLRGDADGIPQVRQRTHEGLASYADELKQQHRRSEDRLAYVAATRARHCLVASRHRWRPGAKRPLAASVYFEVMQRHTEMAGHHRDLIDATAVENPASGQAAGTPWPAPVDEIWRAAQRRTVRLMHEPTDDPLGPDDETVAQHWHDRVTDQLRRWRDSRQPRSSREVDLPTSMSTTALLTARRAPEDFAADLVRPMPRQPRSQTARGIRFHEWVEDFYRSDVLFAAAEEVSSADEAWDDEDLAALVTSFRQGCFAGRQPYAIEEALTLSLDVAGQAQVIRGRVDAVFVEPDGSWLLVDWKTQPGGQADPLQLACYRLAWARQQHVDPTQVHCGFYYVRQDRLVMVDDLPGEEGIVALLEALVNDPVEGTAQA